MYPTTTLNLYYENLMPTSTLLMYPTALPTSQHTTNNYNLQK